MLNGPSAGGRLPESLCRFRILEIVMLLSIAVLCAAARQLWDFWRRWSDVLLGKLAAAILQVPPILGKLLTASSHTSTRGPRTMPMESRGRYCQADGIFRSVCLRAISRLGKSEPVATGLVHEAIDGA